MFLFEKDQTIVEIAGIPIGGQPGEYPTVLIGSIFYQGHKIVQDFQKGVFDKAAAEALLNQQDSLSEKTGLPCIVDVIGDTPEALINFIEFVVKHTDAPFLIDSTRPEIRLPAARYALETGLGARTIYNSIEYSSGEEELIQLREIGVKNAILLAYNPHNVWPEGTLEMVKGTPTQKGLLQKSQEAQIENILVDTAVLDTPSIGLAAKAIHLVKSHLGLPAGCGPSNAIATWKKLRAEFSYDAYTACAAASGAVPITLGGDFILYGPIAFAERVFPVYGMFDAILAYYANRQLGIRTKVKRHPLYMIFRE